MRRNVSGFELGMAFLVATFVPSLSAKNRRRTGRLLTLCLAVVGAVAFASPFAAAQLPEAGAVTDPVTDPVELPVEVPPVESAPVPGDDPSGESGGGGVLPGDGVVPIEELPGGDIVKEVIKPVAPVIEDPMDGGGKLVDEPTRDIKETLEGKTSPVFQPVQDAVGSVTSGGVNPPTVIGDGGDGPRTRTGNNDDPQGGSAAPGSTLARAGESNRPLGLVRNETPASVTAAAPVVAVEPIAASEPSLAEQIGRAAVEAAKKLAFPLALVAAVAAFLMIQGRLDRKDPKLAGAPVDADEEKLSFS